MDRQTVLVNSARALKFLETYGDRQMKLWKVLTKYQAITDHFHDLKTKLETDFVHLKKANLKNFENLQQTLKLQQTYITALCTQVDNLNSKLAQLETVVQTHCIYPYPQIDPIQIDALKYDSDIDGPIDQPSTSPHANNLQTEITPVIGEPEQNSVPAQDPDRSEYQPRFTHENSKSGTQDLDEILELEDESETQD